MCSGSHSLTCPLRTRPGLARLFQGKAESLVHSRCLIIPAGWQMGDCMHELTVLTEVRTITEQVTGRWHLCLPALPQVFSTDYLFVAHSHAMGPGTILQFYMKVTGQRSPRRYIGEARSERVWLCRNQVQWSRTLKPCVHLVRLEPPR